MLKRRRSSHLYIAGDLDLVTGSDDDEGEGRSGLTLAGTVDKRGVSMWMDQRNSRSIIDEVSVLTRSGCQRWRKARGYGRSANEQR